MRLVIFLLTLFLTIAISSCRASRDSTHDSTTASAVNIDRAGQVTVNDDLLTLLKTTCEMDISGLRLEFYPPDSTTPGARASPKALTIDNLKAAENTSAMEHEVMAVDDKETVNLSTRNDTSCSDTTLSEVNAFHPPDWAIIAGVILLILIAATICYLRFRKT